MFNRTQMAAMAERLPREPRPTFIAVYFENPVGEAMGAMHRGFKRWFSDALEFWIGSSRRAAATYPDFADAGRYDLCKPISEAEFQAVARQCLNAVQTIALNPQGAFVAAMQMSDEWNEIAAVAEYGEEFIAVYWTTGA